MCCLSRNVVEMSTGEPSFFPLFRPLQKLENGISEML